jgi:hypothetical protein
MTPIIIQGQDGYLDQAREAAMTGTAEPSQAEREAHRIAAKGGLRRGETEWFITPDPNRIPPQQSPDHQSLPAKVSFRGWQCCLI